MNLISSMFFMTTLFLNASWASELKSEKSGLADDGSAVFFRPYLETDGQRQYISADESHIPSLCNKFKISKTVSWTAGEAMPNLASFSPNFSSRNIKKKTAILEWLICKASDDARRTRLSDRWTMAEESAQNSGTVLKGITFAVSDDLTMPIAMQSHYDGICKLFGFEHYESKANIESQTKPKPMWMASISRTGSLIQILPYDQAIQSITCQERLTYQLYYRFDLEQLGESLREISVVTRPIIANLLRNIAKDLKATANLEPWKRGRKLTQKDLTAEVKNNISTLIFVSNLIRSIDSPWFIKEVRPLLDTKMDQVQALVGYQVMKDPSFKADPRNMIIAIRLILNFLISIRSEIDEVEVIKWIDSVSMASTVYLTTPANGDSLKKWLIVWDSGEKHRDRWINNSRLQTITQTLGLIGEWISSCN